MALITKIVKPEEFTAVNMAEIERESFRSMPPGMRAAMVCMERSPVDRMQYLLDTLVNQGILGEG